MRAPKQFKFNFKTHGGNRKGAGRKKCLKNELPHTMRPRVDAKTPCHSTVKLRPERPGLRTTKFCKSLLAAIRRAKRYGLFVQHFAIERNHLHLIVEAESNAALTKGMASLLASITWALRKIFRFYGALFVSRYHISKITTPTEMRNTLKYVLFNHEKHVRQPRFADVFSTIFVFDRIDELASVRSIAPPPWLSELRESVASARSWLQAVGWRRAKGKSALSDGRRKA